MDPTRLHETLVARTIDQACYREATAIRTKNTDYFIIMEAVIGIVVVVVASRTNQKSCAFQISREGFQK
jgi:hypothetical protein